MKQFLALILLLVSFSAFSQSDIARNRYVRFPAATTPTLEITNLLPVDYEISTITVGGTFLTDRSFTITSLPAEIDGEVLIKTANDDKNGGDVSFDINVEADVYIGYDNRYAPESWMSTFTVVGSIVTSNEDYDLYKKHYAAGTVDLGSNFTGLMYIVIVKP